jgi:hypothetical protein
MLELSGRVLFFCFKLLAMLGGEFGEDADILCVHLNMSLENSSNKINS